VNPTSIVPVTIHNIRFMVFLPVVWLVLSNELITLSHNYSTLKGKFNTFMRTNKNSYPLASNLLIFNEYLTEHESDQVAKKRK